MGTSESGVPAEVEAEQALPLGEHLLAMTNEHEHALTGPAALEASNRLNSFVEHTGFAGAVITDPHRLHRVMARHDPHIYPGAYATGVFNLHKALCLPRTKPTTAGPSTVDCQPLDCRDVALARANTAALREEADRLAAASASRRTLAPLLLANLAARREKITELLDSTAGDDHASRVAQ